MKVSWNKMIKGKIYIHQPYHDFFWGPFDTIKEAREFVKDKYWDYDGYWFLKGNPEAKELNELEQIPNV